MAFKPIQIVINAKDNASAVFDGLLKKVATVGVAILSYFGVKSFLGAVSGAAEFEKALSGVQAATNASAEEMAQLRKAAEGLEDFGGAEAALALENLGKAGLSAGDAIAALGPSAALAKAGQIGLGEASEALTQVIFGLGLSFTESARVADVLAAGANATKTSVAGLTQGLSYAAPVANTLGLSLETTVALLGQFAQGGIDASRAGTALNSIMSQFLDPASKFRSELSAAGITTSDFEKALQQLAAAGPAGAKAINAVGLESGPALRAMLNLGMGSLDALVMKLKSAEGEAARTAGVMRNNLTGSVSGLGKAWEYLTNTLTTPVLPVLKDGVDQLAAAFRNAVADGTVAKFGESIATAFKGGIQFVRDFISTVDFGAVLARMQALADGANDALTKVGVYATNAGNTVKAAYGVIQTSGNTLLTGLYGTATGLTLIIQGVIKGLELLYVAASKVTFGDVSKQYAQIAADLKVQSDAMGAAVDALSVKVRESMGGIADGVQNTVEGFAGLAGAVQESEPAAKAAAQAFDDMGKRLEEVRQKTQQVQKTTDDKRSSDEAATKAVRDLRAEYENAVDSKNWQEAARVQGELRKALDGTKQSAKEVAEAVAGAFKTLKMSTTEDLNETAANASRAFDVITKGGVTSATTLTQAFSVYANAAMEAAERQGEAAVRATRALLDSKAAAAGLRLEVTDSGNVIVRSMREAAKATDFVGSSARGAAGGYRDMGAAAAQAAEQVKKLQAIYDRNKVGDGSDLVGKSGDVREAAIMEYDINQAIAKRYGDDAVGNDLAEQAFDLRLLLESYQRNYGNARSQQSLDQQRNIGAELARVEALLNADLQGGAAAGGGGQRPAGGGTTNAPTGNTTTPRGGSGGGGGNGGGVSQQPLANQFSIVINANGINDPVKLARMLEPELKKMQARAR